jgi:predicted DCC family thiol-disulfide oxidoreductase YuxK
MSERTGKAHTLVLYDGVCALCNRLVRFLLRFDHQDEFRFAALQSEFARQVLERHGIHAAELNTVCVVADYGLAGETALTKSSASLHAVERLGGVWRLIARAARFVPRRRRDFIYDTLARCRYRVFGRYDACPLPPEQDKKKFLAL